MTKKGFNFKFEFKDIIEIVSGIFIMGIGSGINYFANIGGGSIGTMVQGVHQMFNVTEGQADILISCVFLIPMFFLAKDLVGIGTAISLFGIGIAVDIGKSLMSMINIPYTWPVRIILFFVASIISSIGSSMYMCTGAGIGSFDASVLVFYRMTKFDYAKASIIANLFYTFIGWLMGGTVGIGTFIGIITGGYIHQFFMKRVYKWIGESDPLKK